MFKSLFCAHSMIAIQRHGEDAKATCLNCGKRLKKIPPLKLDVPTAIAMAPGTYRREL